MAKKTVKWSKKIEDFILDEMCKGIEPATIFRTHADKLPSLRTFNRKQIDDAEFKEKVDAAYTVIYQLKQAEMTELTSKLASELRPGHDFKEVEAWRRARLDALKFELGKLAGVFSRRYDKKQTVEHTGNVSNECRLVLPNWANQEKIIQHDDQKDE